MSRAIGLSRTALRGALGKKYSTMFEIADPKAHNGMIMIARVKDNPEVANIIL